MAVMKEEQLADIEQDVQKKFDIAVQLVKSLPQSASFQPSYSEATKIYSYFKQSKFGPCTNSRPGFWDVVNRAKWDAWSALGNMPQEVAMKNYVEEIKKVYYRIKDIDEFEEKHGEFADVLIPFCQLTGTQLTNKLMEIVKQKQLDEEEKPTQMNGHAYTNVRMSCDKNASNGTNDEEILLDENSSGSYDSNSVSPQNGIKYDDVLIDTDTHNLRQHQNSAPASKNVKFKITDSDNNDDYIDDDNEKCLPVGIENSASITIDEVELSTSGNDSDDEEIYCDSIDPDKIHGEAKIAVKSDPDLLPTANPADCQLFTPTHPSDITAGSTIFSATANGFSMSGATNAANLDANFTSSNNGRNDFEIAGMDADNNKHVQSVRKRDHPDSYPTCDIVKDLRKQEDRKKHLRKTSFQDMGKSSSSPNLLEYPCNCGVKTHKKQGHHTGQFHSTHRHDNQAQRNGVRDNGSSNGLNGQANAYNHGRHSHRGHSDGSNNDGSDDDSCTSISSSSSDNVGLKIVKALERMDDNMHLILDRLDSIDTSMKILTAPPETPWWIKMMPSKFIVLSTLWPVIVNLLFYYFWRRRRRYQLRKLKYTI